MLPDMSCYCWGRDRPCPAHSDHRPVRARLGLPLSVDTSLEYEVDRTKFPGLDAQGNADPSQPMLILAPRHQLTVTTIRRPDRQFHSTSGLSCSKPESLSSSDGSVHHHITGSAPANPSCTGHAKPYNSCRYTPQGSAYNKHTIKNAPNTGYVEPSASYLGYLPISTMGTGHAVNTPITVERACCAPSLHGGSFLRYANIIPSYSGSTDITLTSAGYRAPGVTHAGCRDPGSTSVHNTQHIDNAGIYNHYNSNVQIGVQQGYPEPLYCKCDVCVHNLRAVRHTLTQHSVPHVHSGSPAGSRKRKMDRAAEESRLVKKRLRFMDYAGALFKAHHNANQWNLPMTKQQQCILPITAQQQCILPISAQQQWKLPSTSQQWNLPIPIQRPCAAY